MHNVERSACFLHEMPLKIFDQLLCMQNEQGESIRTELFYTDKKKKERNTLSEIHRVD